MFKDIFILFFALVTVQSELVDKSNFIQNVENVPRTELIIESHGYPYEEHFTTSSDGYILKLYRIPRGLAEPEIKDRPVAYLQHGLLCSSADWVITGPSHALGFILADHGYDVWMGNVRGNTHSRKHEFLDPESEEFWNFSWHEIGKYDLPALIDYVTQNTSQEKIHYVGHSQGTTSFFVMGSIRPEYNDKIKTMHALAPIAFMSHLKSPFIRAISPFEKEIDWISEMLGLYEFLPSGGMMELGGLLLCHDTSIVQEVCANVLFLIAGYDSPQLNRTHLPLLMKYTPAGASVKQIIHYAQGINSGRFRYYDHGPKENINVYGSATPPDYKLQKIRAPVFLHYSENDWLAAIVDVKELSEKLGNVGGLFHVPDRLFNHLDYTYAIHAKELVYNRVIRIMDENN